MDKFEVKLICDALVDQNKYIGDDPVGHACFNEAKYETAWIDGEPILLCEECSQILLTDLARLTFLTPYTGSQYQLEFARQTIKDIGIKLQNE